MVLSCLTCVLKTIDFFGVPFNFTINRENRYRSTFGGILSLFIICIIVSGFGYFASELINRNKFTLLTQEMLTDSPPSLFIDRSNFTMIFSLKNRYEERIYDERMFTMELYQSIIENGTLGNITVPLVDCHSEDIFEEIKPRMLVNSKCIDPSFKKVLIVNGTEDDEIVSSIYFRIKICEGKSNCYDKETIKEALQDSTVSFTFTSYYIAVTEYPEIIKRNLLSNTFILDANFTRNIDYFSKNLFMRMDDNLFYEKYQIKPLLLMDTNYNHLKYDKTSNIFELRINLSNSVVNYYIQYSKLLSIFVNMGGLINSMFVVGSFITHWINQIRMKLYIMNRLFDFVQDEDELNTLQRRKAVRQSELDKFMNNLITQNRGKRSVVSQFSLDVNGIQASPNNKTIELNVQNNVAYMPQLDTENNNINSEKSIKTYERNSLKLYPNFNNKDVEGLLRLETKRNISFTLTYSNLLKLAISRCLPGSSKGKDTRVKLYRKAETEIDKTFDVVEIFRELHKMSGFLKLILSESQMLLLENIERPKIVFKNLKPDSMTKKIEKLKKYFSAYKELKSDSDNLINVKLLNKLDDGFREIFENLSEKY